MDSARSCQKTGDGLREESDHAALAGATLLAALTALGTGIGTVSIAVILAANAA